MGRLQSTYGLTGCLKGSVYVLGKCNDKRMSIWGTEEDIEAYNNESSIKSPIFLFDFSTGIVQTGPNSLSDSSEDDLKEFGLKEIKLSKLMWGTYPVSTLEAIDQNESKLRAAWVGLNSPEGYVVSFILVEPDKLDDKEILGSVNPSELWDNFIKNTTQLQEPDFFIALGMNMKEGYTTYKTGPAKLKFHSEYNSVKDEHAVIIESPDEFTSYEVEEIQRVYLGTSWKHGEPCLKVHGKLNYKKGNFEINDRTVITILPNTVAEYTFLNNVKNNQDNFQVFYEKI